MGEAGAAEEEDEVDIEESHWFGRYKVILEKNKMRHPLHKSEFNRICHKLTSDVWTDVLKSVML